MKYITYAASLIGFLSSKTLYGNVGWSWSALRMIGETSWFDGHYVSYIISLTIGFLLKLYIVKKLTPKASNNKIFFVTLFMNLTSVTLGTIITVLTGILTELGFEFIDPIGSFLPYINIPIIFCTAIAINTIMEGYIASVCFKKINKKHIYFYIFLANTLSTVIDVVGIIIRRLI